VKAWKTYIMFCSTKKKRTKASRWMNECLKLCFIMYIIYIGGSIYMVCMKYGCEWGHKKWYYNECIVQCSTYMLWACMHNNEENCKYDWLLCTNDRGAWNMKVNTCISYISNTTSKSKAFSFSLSFTLSRLISQKTSQ
jgi:hypothetical protein